ncbi:hypothetical protein DPMN_108839 [Dreissena polymorpha]|uniref:Uncharacterized protein n=1 Tax=Dreissena polymorpha TaxID=45954 RepID=A0A9D4K9J4_DREPO|nr:hypothetical protein DPMN_108839 [Dreissena polymorpha]
MPPRESESLTLDDLWNCAMQLVESYPDDNEASFVNEWRLTTDTFPNVAIAVNFQGEGSFYNIITPEEHQEEQREGGHRNMCSLGLISALRAQAM